MKIYLASPFFNETELEAVAKAEQILRARGIEVYSPREHEYRGAEAGTTVWAEAIFQEDVAAIRSAERMVMLYHGNYSDSGTSWECGFAYALGLPVVAVQLGNNANLMVHRSATANITLEELASYDFDTMPKRNYEGEMF